MKSNELRIGNSILMNGEVVHNIGYAVIMDVHQINKGVKNEYLNTVKYEPIPLSEKRLLEFGFEPKYDSENNNIDFYSPEGGLYVVQLHVEVNDFIFYDCDGGIGVRIEYVHQLQNLYFCLVGDELMVNK